MSIENLKSFGRQPPPIEADSLLSTPLMRTPIDPFHDAEADEDTSVVKSQQEDYVHIRIQR